MNQELFITGAGVSADSGIPTFRGTDGFWTIGSVNYTPQEMATRRMYENDPEEFLLWYFKRFVSLQDSKPNFSHFWLADKLLITQNIDGLDGKAGNKKYIPIHGRLDKLIIYDDQENIQVPFDANWQDIIQNVERNNLFALRENLLKKCKITKNESEKNYMPQRGISLKPFVLLFDEYYTENYRISEAIKLMSYITSDFATNSDMKVGAEEWQAVIQDMLPRFKKAGAVRQTVSQIWNKEGVYRLGNMWEYKDEKAFIECQKLFREAEMKFDEKSKITVKNFSNRGIILYDVIL